MRFDPGSRAIFRERTVQGWAEGFSRARARHPLAATLELTYRCNFRCSHCFCLDPEPDPGELGLAEWNRLLGEMAAEGVLFLTLTGGEPLRREDFGDLWVAARRRGFVLDLFSNGSLLESHHVDLLRRWPPRRASITLYGASEATYQRVTGRAGMHRRVLAALDRLAAAGVPLELKAVFTRDNVHEFAALQEMMQSYHCPWRWTAELNGCYARQGNRPLEVRLAPEEILALERRDPRRCAEWRQQFAIAREAPPTSRERRCRLGEEGFHLTPRGELRGCMLLEDPSYDARAGSIGEGWRVVLPRLLQRLPLAPDLCRECRVSWACRSCPAATRLEHTALEQPHAPSCQLTRLRASAFEKEQP